MEKIITCPNCNDYIIISELNCCIFRCGIYKKTNEQIDPHLPRSLQVLPRSLLPFSNSCYLLEAIKKKYYE